MSVSWNSKKECRSFFKSLCAQESAPEHAQRLVQNQQHLNVSLRAFLSAQKGIWGAYRALPEEAQVEEVFKISHLTWAFPKMRTDAKGERNLEFFIAQQFALGPYGVMEPVSNTAPQKLQELSGLLVPGLVFNKNGNRLGKGKGFYDKTLEAYTGLKAGICFDFQISTTTLPMESHDVKVDYLITESGIIDCNRYQSI